MIDMAFGFTSETKSRRHLAGLFDVHNYEPVAPE